MAGRTFIFDSSYGAWIGQCADRKNDHMTRLHRRTFLIGGIASTGATLLSARTALAIAYPFTLGVASGEPTSDGFVIWTRLAPGPLNADGLGGMSSVPVTVEWQVSNDRYLTQLARTGSVTAVQASAHSVHVEVTGLQPGREYWYRFRASGHISQVGRARTAPAVGTSPALTMLFASCSHYEAGYFTAYRRMAEERPDLILHLGDYLYEGDAGSGVRTHTPSAEISSLANYRVRHALYKRDVDLQAAHAAGGLGRPRGGEQLRQPRPQRQLPGRWLPGPARRGVPGVLRAHAAVRGHAADLGYIPVVITDACGAGDPQAGQRPWRVFGSPVTLCSPKSTSSALRSRSAHAPHDVLV
jgi:hypothetical protein